MEKVKTVLDNKATWGLLAMIAGAFGEKALGITNAIGALVMAAL